MAEPRETVWKETEDPARRRIVEIVVDRPDDDRIRVNVIAGEEGYDTSIADVEEFELPRVGGRVVIRREWPIATESRPNGGPHP